MTAPRRVLVTGLSGFVGRHVAAIFRELLPDTGLLPLGCDVADGQAVRRAVRDARPDGVLHLAAVSAIPLAQKEPDRAWAVNLHGTLNLARAVLEEAPGAPFLFASSADAYGASFRSGVALGEDAPLAPLNIYGATKAAADLALGAMAASDGLRAIRLRPFNHTGAGQSDGFAVPAFAAQLAAIGAGNREPVLRIGNLDASRDFLDVRDVARAYALCFRHADRLAPGTMINLCSGSPRRIGDVLDALIRLSGLRPRIETDPARLRPSDIPMARGDASRAQALLGWTPEIGWDDTLRAVLADWRDRTATGG
ncbi:GDP-mannose 4,6-dehydratase [Rhizosaccharibacter radicis]|uniref:GDP-mannose 4,6-dehydratase n=1 Tax=Rhizosaccharibacter radicis TaxID=2782605 RepID=A0ABT1VV23_9PROT|nr:GDP-mannose 4,6-dehydratase [Acetobacteraceae bacterium KSS12]